MTVYFNVLPPKTLCVSHVYGLGLIVIDKMCSGTGNAQLCVYMRHPCT